MNSNKTDSRPDCPTVGLDGIRYLETLAPWRGKGGFSLDKMRDLMNELGNPQDSYSSIHVAGTNGKGSVSVALSAIIAASGSLVGMTTSPHLTCINERIVIDGRPIADALLSVIALEVAKAAKTRSIELSFFEGITACAFLAFAKAKVDWAILEVGLGGRLDATNVVLHPKAHVIVSIDFDHQEILGASLQKIALEKAGIIKNSGAPTIIGEMAAEAAGVIAERAKSRGSKLIRPGADYSWNTGNVVNSYIFNSMSLGTLEFTSSLAGEHQGHNMAVAIATARTLGFELNSIRQGIANCFWPARLEAIDFDDCHCIVDCAHNPAGVGSLERYLARSGINSCFVVFGALNTKDWREMAVKLVPFASKWLLVRPDSPSAVSPDSVEEYLSGIGVSQVSIASDYSEVVEALRSWKGTAVMAGSIYMVGPLRGMIANSDFKYWKSCSTSSTSIY